MAEHITVDELKRKIGSGEDIIILDVRNREELQYGMIPGHVFMPMDEVPGRLAELPKGKEILCLCRTGHRSGEVAAFLRQQGFDAKNIAGGIFAWKKYDPSVQFY